jgi:hypothetical protein
VSSAKPAIHTLFCFILYLVIHGIVEIKNPALGRVIGTE